MKQEAQLLWQRDCATRLSVLESRAYPVFIQYRSVTDTHTDRQTDGQTHDDGMYRA